MNMFRLPLLAAVLCFFSLSSLAGEAEVRKSLRGKIVGGENAEIQPAPIPGIFEVIAASQLYYVTADGRYLFQGNAFDLLEGKDLTEPRMNDVRAKQLSAVGDASSIIYSPKDGKVKHRITVFTDIECYYCRKMHEQMEGYLARGIEVQYLFYPRKGLNSAGAKQAEAVWCADNRLHAMDEAKAQRPIEARSCANPVKDHYLLGRELGVRATPTIMTSSGQVIPGFRPPAALEQELKPL